MTKPRRHLDLRGREERAAEVKAANQREANIAKAYLNSGPSLGNLVRTAYHWYNSVPMLGGQNESGLDLQTGEAPTPGMRNPKNIVNTISKLNKAFDKHYFAALSSGDLKGASNLREAHFRVYAPKSKVKNKVYHGTKNKFNNFDESRINTNDAGTFGRGIYTTPSKNYAQLYGDNIMPLYVNITNPKDYRNAPIGDIIAEKLAFGDYFGTGIGIDGVLGRPNWKGVKGLEEVVIHDPKNVKSAKIVVRDDSNNIIPLSQRDNFNVNDIRFKDGGSIHIAPSKRGTFTAAATKHGMGVQEFASKVLRNKENYSPSLVKKANFARNASKWNH